MNDRRRPASLRRQSAALASERMKLENAIPTERGTADAQEFHRTPHNLSYPTPPDTSAHDGAVS
jgi:hypothetical protein